MAKKPKTPTVFGGVAPLISAVFAANPAVASAVMDLMSRNVGFMTSRFEANVEAQKDLVACWTPVELMAVYAEFLSNAMQDYADETARVIEATTKISNDIANDLKSGHARGYDDVPV